MLSSVEHTKESIENVVDMNLGGKKPKTTFSVFGSLLHYLGETLSLNKNILDIKLMDFLCQQQEEQPKQTKHLLYLPAAYVKGMYYLLNKNGQIMHEMNVF